MEKDIFPAIGKTPIADLRTQDVLGALGRLEARKSFDACHRISRICSQIFRYAVVKGIIEYNPASDLKGALSPVQRTHFASITDPRKVAELLLMIDAYDGSFIVKYALQLAPLVFARPGELRNAQWKDIDLEKKEWKYFVTKTKTPHIVPLSNQAIEILKKIKQVTRESPFVFPGRNSIKKPMSDGALLVAMRRMGIPKKEMTPHGFRAMARTILDEVLKFRPDYIEHQLAHAVRDPNGRAYNRTAHLDERKKMMKEWSDYLDELKAGGTGK